MLSEFYCFIGNSRRIQSTTIGIGKWSVNYVAPCLTCCSNNKIHITHGNCHQRARPEQQQQLWQQWQLLSVKIFLLLLDFSVCYVLFANQIVFYFNFFTLLLLFLIFTSLLLLLLRCCCGTCAITLLLQVACLIVALNSARLSSVLFFIVFSFIVFLVVLVVGIHFIALHCFAFISHVF